MPTYDYKCNKCGEHFELIQKMTEPAKADCPKCGAPAERLISGGGGLLFKGSGFYSTDYRSESYKKKASEDQPAKSCCSAKPETKSKDATSKDKK